MERGRNDEYYLNYRLKKQISSFKKHTNQLNFKWKFDLKKADDIKRLSSFLYKIILEDSFPMYKHNLKVIFYCF